MSSIPVRCLNSSPAMCGAVPLPVSHPTSCAFGGAALDELYVTSARRPLSVEERKREPEAGSLLRLRPGVKGRPPNLFGGRA